LATRLGGRSSAIEGFTLNRWHVRSSVRLLLAATRVINARQVANLHHVSD
jgi:hypothetical protein